jgi:hypothetical protein
MTILGIPAWEFKWKFIPADVHSNPINTHSDGEYVDVDVMTLHHQVEK